MKRLLFILALPLAAISCSSGDDGIKAPEVIKEVNNTKDFAKPRAFQRYELVGSWLDAGVKFAVYRIDASSAIYASIYNEGYTILDTMTVKNNGAGDSGLFEFYIQNGIDSGGVFTIDKYQKTVTYLDRSGDKMNYKLLDE